MADAFFRVAHVHDDAVFNVILLFIFVASSFSVQTCYVLHSMGQS